MSSLEMPIKTARGNKPGLNKARLAGVLVLIFVLKVVIELWLMKVKVPNMSLIPFLNQ